jgi:predicted phage-related endonuclease
MTCSAACTTSQNTGAHKLTPRPRRMKVERHRTAPGELSPLRANDVTGTEASALVGLNPHLTHMELFARKTGVEMPPNADNVAMRRGRLMEDVVARAFLEENPGFKVTKANLYLRAPLLRLGASLDYLFVDPQGRKGPLENKTVAADIFKKQYTDETPPTHHILQCLVQMMLLNSEVGWLAALEIDGYHFKLHSYRIPRHPAAERRIQCAVAQFWSDIDAGRTPNIDYTRDGSLLPVLFPHHVEGKVVDLRGDNALPALLDEREALKDEIATKIARKEAIETELKYKMGDAEAALLSGWRISHRDQHRKEHMVKASDFRVLRIARDTEAQKAIAAA